MNTWQRIKKCHLRIYKKHILLEGAFGVWKVYLKHKMAYLRVFPGMPEAQKKMLIMIQSQLEELNIERQ